MTVCGNRASCAIVDKWCVCKFWKGGCTFQMYIFWLAPFLLWLFFSPFTIRPPLCAPYGL